MSLPILKIRLNLQINERLVISQQLKLLANQIEVSAKQGCQPNRGANQIGVPCCIARRQPKSLCSVAEQLASVEKKHLEKYSTECQPEGCLCSKLAPEAKSEVFAKTREGRSGSKTQSTGVEVSYDFKAIKAAQAWSININCAGLSQSKSVKGAAIKAYPLTKWQ